MQTKVTFFVYNKDNYAVGNPQKLVIDEFTKEDLGDRVATFYEYYKIVVSVESTDPNAILIIDSSTSELPIQLTAKDRPFVLSGSGDHDIMLTPGYYGIQVITSDGIYNGLYLINPTSVSWNGLINLRNYLEKIMIGLSQNLYIQRMTGQKNIYGDNEYSLNKLYSYIISNIETVSSNIENIIKKPLSDIDKLYREQHYSVRQDMKSQKWLSSKGVNKNKNPYVPEVVYEKHTVLNRDISENQWIKKIINKTIEILCDMESKYIVILNEFSKKVNSKETVLLEKTSKYNSIINDAIVSNEHKYSVAKELQVMETDLNKLKSNRIFISDIVLNLEKLKSILIHYANETWFGEIFDNLALTKVSQKMLKDNRYFVLYDFYNNIISLENNENIDRKPYFPSKKTSKLFEYYALVMVIGILEDCGFEWESGWLRDMKNEEMFNGEIPTNEPIIFSKDNILCELFYEKEVKQNIDVASNNISDFVRMSARHYKPDILISLFDKESHVLIKSAVVEVKCAMSKNLHSSNGPTRAIEQAKDYYSFCYYDKNKRGKNKTKRGVIEEIIIIYPKQEKKITYDYDDINLSFIQVEALEDEDINKHYGYNELKRELKECLDLI
ncbi:hypothetical protein [Clostridium sp. C8-1-8]|uniref:hypothetical protein n=1 Tax=Clostridium sp. C8-1-8 TaxID=2698831 RepID=UPI00136DDC80|nr:hypothetical protein [Clostridium sp. C8-1-8]